MQQVMTKEVLSYGMLQVNFALLLFLNINLQLQGLNFLT